MEGVKHTPGEITQDGFDLTSVIEWNGAKWIQIAKCNSGEGDEALRNDVKNAKLFAASQDMFDAIKCALNLKDLWSAQQHSTISADHAGEMEALQKMQDKLEAALKKATT